MLDLLDLRSSEMTAQIDPNKKNAMKLGKDRNIFFEVGFYPDGVASIRVNAGREMVLNPQNNPNFKFEKSGPTSSIETWFGLHLGSVFTDFNNLSDNFKP